jgi:lipopolysaccharide biosynthesis regulator YciM
MIPDTSDLHFALGNLFRRRGEVRARGARCTSTCTAAPTCRTPSATARQHGLAQDYMRAGLFDRAEEAWKALEGTPSTPRRGSRC